MPAFLEPANLPAWMNPSRAIMETQQAATASIGHNFMQAFMEASNQKSEFNQLRVEDMKLQLEQNKQNINDIRSDQSSFSKWYSDYQKDKAAPEPAWKSDWGFSRSLQVRTMEEKNRMMEEANALRMEQLKAQTERVALERDRVKSAVEIAKASREAKQAAKETKPREDFLKSEISALQREYHKLQSTPLEGKAKKEAGIKLGEIASKIRQYQAEQKSMAIKSSPADKVTRANELSREHPDWTKDQIISAVNDEFTP